MDSMDGIGTVDIQQLQKDDIGPLMTYFGYTYTLGDSFEQQGRSRGYLCGLTIITLYATKFNPFSSLRPLESEFHPLEIPCATN